MHTYDIAAIHYVLLGGVLTAALVSLGLGLRRVFSRLQLGRAVPGRSFTPADVRKRFNAPALLTRGLLTWRLFKRPAAGVAHGLLFVGALIEIVGHAIYPLSFIGVPVYDGLFGFAFMGVARELAGFAMLVGATFFLVRRLLPPERLTVGKPRPKFLRMEVLLLAIVALGFAAEAVRLTDPSVSSRGEFLGAALAAALRGFGLSDLGAANLLVWWIHGLAGSAFVALIAWTPMSHMVLGPANSALATRRSGITLAPIDFDAEPEEGQEPVFGAAKVTDLNQKLLLDLSACLWCGRCHEACPAAQTGKALSPKKVMLACAEQLEQGAPQDVSMVDRIGQQAIFDCTTCGACVEQCPVSNSPAEVVMEFRRHLVMDRSEMPTTMAAANRNLESRGHPFVGTAANPDDWRRGLDVPIFEPGVTEYLLWLGCAVTYEERAQQVARSMVKILETAGVSYGIMDGPRCTGDPAKMMGNEMQFVETAQANIEEFKELKIQKVITMCAHCFNSFDRYYPELGADWKTIPHSVLIDQLVAEGKLKLVRNEAEKITFHDPCYLGRQNDILDQPRNVVSALGQLVEMPRNRKESACCGAGGGNYWGGQGGTARINDVRAEEALATGADKIATSCPFCLLMLTSGTAKQTEKRKVFDVAELVVAALPGTDKATPAP